MAYSFSGRVRYSEIGENGLLTLPGILNYFQDCSTFHSEAAGLGVKVLKEKNKFWVLSAWQVIINRYPYLGEEIVTSTWPYGFRGFMGFRNFTMDTAEGERLAYANTFWTFIDGKNGLPCKGGILKCLKKEKFSEVKRSTYDGYEDCIMGESIRYDGYRLADKRT